MKIVVVGLGTFGQSVALHLARAGVEVIAIDSNMDLVDDVKDEVAVAVKLDATDEKELRAHGVHEADALVASMGDKFEVNQLLVMLAKQMGIPRVVARARAVVHARILRLIGADEVVLAEERSAEDLARRLSHPSLKGYFELIEGYSVAEIEAPASFHGRSLEDLDLKKRFRVAVVAITRAAEKEGGKHSVNVVPLGKDVILKGDVLAVVGSDVDIKSLLLVAPA